MRAFSGYLSSKEILLLWDKILAYDSLEILPGEKVSKYFFTFRKNAQSKNNLVFYVEYLFGKASILLFHKEKIMKAH